jgi:hypothetical protein
VGRRIFRSVWLGQRSKTSEADEQWRIRFSLFVIIHQLFPAKLEGDDATNHYHCPELHIGSIRGIQTGEIERKCLDVKY